MLAEVERTSWGRERLLESLEAYRGGLSDAPLLRKWGNGEVRAGESEPGAQMTFVISTDEVDRHGDVIAPEGWRLEAYLRNPVFLWAHDYLRPVIGRAVSVWKEPHRLLARMEFAPTDFAQEVALLYQHSYQRGVSVGFRPISFEERREEKTGAFLGIRFLEQELLEVSAVPVPANRSALRRAFGDERRRMKDERSPSLAFRPSSDDVGGIWPELAARIDDLSKMAEELAEMVESVELSVRRGPPQEGLAQMLAVLREAKALAPSNPHPNLPPW